MPFTLRTLLTDCALPSAVETIEINGIELDSRIIESGNLFIALRGANFSAEQFVDTAIAKGAAAVAIEADVFEVNYQGTVPLIFIPHLREKVSSIASQFYKHPSSKMVVTGVTGTNGKTSCTLMLAQLTAKLLGPSSVVGTTGYGLLDANALTPLKQQIALLVNTGLTTPDPISLQKILASLHERGAAYSAIEVSSHSLDQSRAASIQFHCAIFTNLSQDHLDYHGTLESYGAAKEKLLTMPNLKVAVINLDDPWAATLVNKIPFGVKHYTYGLTDSADIRATDVRQHTRGTSAYVITPWGEGTIDSPFFGLFNLSNLLGVIASVCAQGAAFESVKELIPQLVAAPGRLQSINVDETQDVQVFVDYAHTPDALEKTLDALHQHKSGRIWTLFGCGGERDKTKRPLMGRIAERQSDYVLVTNDNPRSEDPASIVADIVKGLKNPKNCLVIADRAQAIDFAIAQAKSEDIILIAGKGHEDYQIFKDKTVPFSDSQQARLAIQRRLAKRDKALHGEIS